MKIVCKIVVSVLLGIVVASCSFLPNELKQAESLIETAPDSALHILQHLSPEKYKSDESRALYGMLMIQALDKKVLPLKPDSLLDFSIAYYQEHPDKDRLATCYLYKGRAYKNNYQDEDAIDFYLKALDETQNSDNNLLIGRIVYDLGCIYNMQRDYSLSRQKFKIAYSCFTKAKSQLMAFYSLLYIGRTYHEAKDYKRAQIYYNRILSYAKDSLQKGALLQEIGLNLYDSHQYDSALKCLRKVIHYPYIGNNRAIRYSLIADLFFDIQQFDSAHYYALETFRYKPDIRTQRENYRILVNAANAKGDVAQLKTYMAFYQNCTDSIRKIDAQTKGSVLETIHTTKQEVAKTKSWLWYLLYTLLGVVVSAVGIYIIKHRKNIKDRQLAEENHVRQKVVMRKQVIGDKRTVLQQKISEIKAAGLTENKGLSLAQKEEKIRKIYDDLLHINDQRFFFEEMDIVFNKLVTKLQTRYSDIKPKELTWCCLHLLNIPGHDMLILLDYKTHNSLKTLKGRLSDKFGLENASLLGDFLMTLLSED